jgi:hypothetical protein
LNCSAIGNFVKYQIHQITLWEYWKNAFTVVENISVKAKIFVLKNVYGKYQNNLKWFSEIGTVKVHYNKVRIFIDTGLEGLGT